MFWMKYSIVDPTNSMAYSKAIDEEVDFKGFIAHYGDICEATPEGTPKSQLKAICTGIFSDDRRLNVNLLEVSLLHGDVDDITPAAYERLLGDVKKMGLNHLIIESPSSNENHRKYRVYFELDEKATSHEDYKGRGLPTLKRHFPYIDWDTKCGDSARFMYVPDSSKLGTISYSHTGNKIKTIRGGMGMREKVAQMSTSSYPNSSHCKYKNWALETFDLKVGGKVPHSPFRLDSDSGNYIVNHYGIYDFQSSQVIKWEMLHRALEDFKVDAVHPYFVNLWESKGSPILSTPEKGKDINIPSFIEVMGSKGRYHIVLNDILEMHNHKLIRLDPNKNEFDVCLEIIKNPYIPTYWAKESMGYKTEEDAKFKFYGTPQIKMQYRKTIDTGRVIVLGADDVGIYYEYEKNQIVECLTTPIKPRPVFHQDIHEFLSQLNINLEWIHAYIYFFQDCQKALPWIHAYGEAKAGKTFLAELLGTLFTGSPIRDPLSNDHQDMWGSSPLLLMDEQLPQSMNAKKSAINECKSLCTQYTTQINQKYKAHANVCGYHRLFSTQNADEPELPLEDQSDLSALVRRMQLIKFDKGNKDFLSGIKMARTTAWLNGEFAQHCQYIKENNYIQPSDSLLAVEPLPDRYLNANTVSIHDTARKLIEGMLNICVNKVLQGGYVKSDEDNYYVDVNCTEFQSYLMTHKYITTRFSSKKLAIILKKAFSDSLEAHRVRVKDTGRRRCVKIMKSKVDAMLEEF